MNESAVATALPFEEKDIRLVGRLLRLQLAADLLVAVVYMMGTILLDPWFITIAVGGGALTWFGIALRAARLPRDWGVRPIASSLAVSLVAYAGAFALIAASWFGWDTPSSAHLASEILLPLVRVLTLALWGRWAGWIDRGDIEASCRWLGRGLLVLAGLFLTPTVLGDRVPAITDFLPLVVLFAIASFSIFGLVVNRTLIHAWRGAGVRTVGEVFD